MYLDDLPAGMDAVALEPIAAGAACRLRWTPTGQAVVELCRVPNHMESAMPYGSLDQMNEMRAQEPLHGLAPDKGAQRRADEEPEPRYTESHWRKVMAEREYGERQAEQREHKDIAHRFAFHPADDEEKRAAHTSIRKQCESLAHRLQSQLPPGRERDEAIQSLELAMFWGNAALARANSLRLGLHP